MFICCLVSFLVRKTSQIKITMVVSPIFIENRELNVQADSCINIPTNDMNATKLKGILDELLPSYKACYIERSWECWAIVKRKCVFYLFDPHGIEVPNKKKSTHRAVVYRFEFLTKLIEQFFDCVDEIFKDSREGDYCVGGIMAAFKDEPKIEVKDSKIKKKSTESVQKCPSVPETKSRQKLVINFPDISVIKTTKMEVPEEDEVLNYCNKITKEIFQKIQ